MNNTLVFPGISHYTTDMAQVMKYLNLLRTKLMP